MPAAEAIILGKVGPSIYNSYNELQRQGGRDNERGNVCSGQLGGH